MRHFAEDAKMKNITQSVASLSGALDALAVSMDGKHAEMKF